MKSPVRLFTETCKPVAWRVNPHAPGVAITPLYSIRQWLDYAGEESFQVSMMSTQLGLLDFLYTPTSSRALWDQIASWRLPAFDFLSPAILGLVVRTGGMFQPAAVVYELSAAKATFGSTYWEPSTVGTRKQMAEREESFRNQILSANFGSRTPWFVRCSPF